MATPVEMMSLVAALVDAFVVGGRIKPVLPAGRRDEVLAPLARLMIDPPLLDEFVAALYAERRRRGVDDLLLELPSPELPVEAIFARGLSVLDDDQLADLAICPVGMAFLADFLGEMLTASQVGSFWWQEVARIEEEVPADLRAGEAISEAFRRIKALEAVRI